MSTDSLAARIQRLEDRTEIVELVIAYAHALDRADRDALAATLTDPVHVDFSEAGMPAADFPRDRFVGFAARALEGWTARQHLSPNHRVVFDGADPDRATCHSYMYAQHYKKDAPGGELYLMRGSYEHDVVRTPDGWRIARITQHVSWLEGNPDAVPA
ncbi:hypothetical protein Val02_09240 [Virgisporangium aliadipatigenens]|uniref:SnoaL-like domain-containing protein n=1 Tax=Virgisporangium aliadipatigenens TaxID=741659 RepID=A0A8J4DNX6_9ACTN|nr:nuclear transport factor 2 family protein [Virgisporangium aliadipatigenens]GIJ44038.1 hypothetical protein Val02_09240 [Virgisporangium aliadipatigenens]